MAKRARVDSVLEPVVVVGVVVVGGTVVGGGADVVATAVVSEAESSLEHAAATRHSARMPTSRFTEPSSCGPEM